MAASLLLLLDLGDAFTKGLAVSGGATQRFSFPSVVAHRLLDGGEEETSLLLGDRNKLPRPADFDPRKYPRGRSYPRGSAFLHDVREVPRARFAGWPATACGADRELLGSHPTAENIDALVHKAFMLSGAEGGDADVFFVVDAGVKAKAITAYAEASPRAARFREWTIGCPLPRTVELSVHGWVIDAADCIVEALPEEVSLARVGRLLAIDIGYTRTKLAVFSDKGCEHQQQKEGLGVSDCVQRILRDGQEQGLVEDEFAVIKALEQSQSTIEVAGRSFDMSRTLESATRGLEEEVANIAQTAIVEDYARRGEMCRAVAVVGGGAAIVGEGLAARLEASDLGLSATWVAEDTRYMLVDGAARLRERAE
jgi:hypothetical protein